MTTTDRPAEPADTAEQGTGGEENSASPENDTPSPVAAGEADTHDDVRVAEAWIEAREAHGHGVPGRAQVVMTRDAARLLAEGFEVDYLELPMALRVHLPAVHRIVPFADLGPAVSYRTGCWVDDNGPARDRQTCFAYDRRPGSGGSAERRRLDVSAIAGGGVAIPVAGQRLKLSARYDIGLRRISPVVPTKNRSWIFLTTFDWPIT